MNSERDKELLDKCLKLVASKQNWGDPATWSTKDFERLSEEILQSTGAHLSMATLKRLWGRIKYDSTPTVTTLDVLARYLDFEDWRSFVRYGDKKRKRKKVRSLRQISAVPEKRALIWSIPVLVIAGLFAVNLLSSRSNIDPSRFVFEKQKMEPVGVPNSVIFAYDASVAPDNAVIAIQQSWDKRRTREVKQEEYIHTSMYYYPGYFRAKLVVADQIVKEQEVFIETAGWVSAVEQLPVPVYIDSNVAYSHEGMGLSALQLEELNIPLQPEAPWTTHVSVREYEGLMSDNFTFKTRLKNKHRAGASVCQFSEIHLLFKGGAMMIPLSVRGCVSELDFRDSTGPKDPSGLGVDFNDWVDVSLSFEDRAGKLFVNGAFVSDLAYDYEPKQLIGIRYRFQGVGSVASVSLADKEGNVVYEEDFLR